MNLLSSINRPHLIHQLSSEEYDLLIIGAGITGAGIALDAASRGIKTALIDKQDFASGTSSRSTKLIHGGLRYLQQMEFSLVREVGSERGILYKNAPHLVVPEKMLLPLVKNGNYGKLATSFGLFVYDLLAGVKKQDRRKMLTKEQALAVEPLLNQEVLKGAGLYVEYRTDDARLTIEIIKTAVKNGADAINYVQAENFTYKNDIITGVECQDLLSSHVFKIKAKQIVNASGPWVDELRKKDHYLKGKKLHLTKGVHLVVPKEVFPVKQAIYFDAPDKRMLFAIPRANVTYFGTTDTDYSGNLEHPTVSQKDVEYLINSVNEIFPAINLTKDKIISSWAGIRPLIHEEGKPPYELSRKDEIFVSKSGMISIAGGKLTGYRKMAERVVNKVMENLHERSGFIYVKCKTENIRINGGEFKNPELVDEYILQVFQRIKAWNLNKEKAEYLVRTYGKQTDLLLQKLDEFKDEDPEILLARTELWFTLNYEAVFHLHDFIIRRSGKLYFDVAIIKKLLPVLLSDMQVYHSWSDNETEQEKITIENILLQVTNFKV
ncbi:MAG: glycerol-3-phosphate dehydrogenase/oxidase [Bacteroidota bacterium]|nr:glycerol-3-phosphate dehydrogenase/oxidase [Bacteroidota bacterium]